MASDRARREREGWNPRHSWRDHEGAAPRARKGESAPQDRFIDTADLPVWGFTDDPGERVDGGADMASEPGHGDAGSPTGPFGWRRSAELATCGGDTAATQAMRPVVSPTSPGRPACGRTRERTQGRQVTVVLPTQGRDVSM
jgi:hypothetical protein